MKIISLFSVLFGLATICSAQPKDAEKQFTVRWYGQAFFTITSPSGRVVAFDPHVMEEFPREGKVKADIVCQCHPDADKDRLEQSIEGADTGKVKVFRGYKKANPGKPWDWNLIDEKSAVGEESYRIRTVGNYRDALEGKKWGKNSTFVVEMEGVTFCHLGYLGHTLSKAEIEAIGPVDVLFVPVGGVYMINGEMAREVVSSLKPKRYLFPMAYAFNGQPDTLLSADEFLDGLEPQVNATTTNHFSFGLSQKPAAPTTVVLGWKAGNPTEKK